MVGIRAAGEREEEHRREEHRRLLPAAEVTEGHWVHLQNSPRKGKLKKPKRLRRDASPRKLRERPRSESRTKLRNKSLPAPVLAWLCLRFAPG